MYIRPERKRGSSLLRVLALTAFILMGLWFIENQPEWARPFEPTPTPTLPASYYLTEGDIAFAEGQLRQAVEAYENAIVLEPDNDIPYAKAARTLIYLGDTARALTRAEQAVLLQPNSAFNLAEYCRALDWEGQYGPAFDACDCAIELDPTYAPGYAYLSEVYADQADWILARTTAQKALEVDFQNPEAHHNMGYALEVQGRYAQAVEFYENAITLRPKLAPYYIAAGRNYYWLGLFDKAADRFGEAIKLDPANPVGYDQLGWTYHANGEDGRALDALQQAISVDPTYARAWGRLGTIYYLRQNYEEALKILPTAIDLAENQFLSRARKIQILTQVEGLTGPETVPILQGRFQHPADLADAILTADIRPVRWTTDAPQSEPQLTCGSLIARNIQTQLVLASPVQDIAFSRAFSQTTGRATLDLATGELTLQLENLPPPRNLPYEVQIHYRPNQREGLGYIQPDAQQQVDARFTIISHASAPVEYYYELGLSYVYLTPPRCDKAIPWLLKALDKDPVYYNPAWAGLKICPTENATPTPLPTATPIPESTTEARD